MTDCRLEALPDGRVWEAVTVSICQDCMLFLANGDLPESRPDLPADIDRQWNAGTGPAWDLTPEWGEGSFSWQGCECCGSRLGGDRYAATAYRFHADRQAAARDAVVMGPPTLTVRIPGPTGSRSIRVEPSPDGKAWIPVGWNPARDPETWAPVGGVDSPPDTPAQGAALLRTLLRHGPAIHRAAVAAYGPPESP